MSFIKVNLFKVMKSKLVKSKIIKSKGVPVTGYKLIRKTKRTTFFHLFYDESMNHWWWVSNGFLLTKLDAFSFSYQIVTKSKATRNCL